MKYKDVYKDVYKDMDKVFQDMDKVFKAMDKRMDELIAGAAESRSHPWEKWFAWHPVTIKGKRHWMKTVYRKYNWAKSTEQPFGKGYDYGDIFDVLKEAGDGPKHS